MYLSWELHTAKLTLNIIKIGNSKSYILSYLYLHVKTIEIKPFIIMFDDIKVLNILFV